ncbi:UNVERIFIED_CONTAM: hypothetical protein GTU68_064117 [Idotea baltica]|nr:hypothetical protein [Idotea baltica]
MDDPEALDSLLDAFLTLEGNEILVHGGGKMATSVANQLGIKTQMVAGRRITDEQMLQVAMMVYGGYMNKQLVCRLQAKGTQAIGLTGADGNVIRAHKRPVKDIDYGFVGDIDEVDANFLQRLIAQSIVPVMAPLTHDGKGQMLNTNADTIATVVAKAMSESHEVRLIFAFERPGVLLDPNDDKSWIKILGQNLAHKYQEEGIIAAGMIPKLTNGFDAITSGVNKVLICQSHSLPLIGTADFVGTELIA